MMAAFCKCGHVKGLHEHYRGGSDCAAKKPVGVTPYDDVFLEEACGCEQYRTENWGIIGAAALVLLGIFVIVGIAAMVQP